MEPARLTLVAAAPLVLLALLALAGEAAAAETTISMSGCADGRFNPASLDVEVGDRVTWRNDGTCAHTTETLDDTWNSGHMEPGAVYAWTADEEGTFQYRCLYHPSMVGTLAVAASTNTPPTVSITEPSNGAVVPRGSVTVRGTASSDTTRIDLVIDGVARTPTGIASWSYSWTTSSLEAGSSHTLKAVATDGTYTTETATITVTIESADALPSVSVLTPAAGATVGGTVSVTGSASDDKGVSRVDVRVDGGAWTAATGTTAWSWAWDTRDEPNGPHTIEARVLDTASQEVLSSAVTVTVENEVGDDDPPAITLTFPVEGASLSGRVTLTGNATDDLGVEKVEWRLDDGPWQPATGTAPWTATLDTLDHPDGAHTLEARARDGTGHQATTGSVNVTISNPTGLVFSLDLAPGTVLRGTANLTGDAKGAVAVMLSFDDGPWTNVATVENGTWTYAWDTRSVANGAHAVAARAPDPATGRYVVRGPVQVHVQNERTTPGPDAGDSTNAPPRITKFSPANGTTVSGAVEFEVVASDPDGDAVTIRLSVDRVKLAESPAPLRFSWPAYEVRLGKRSAFAEACDASGCSSTSWSFTVAAQPPAPKLSKGDGANASNESGDDLDGDAIAARLDDETRVPAPGWVAAAAALGAAIVRGATRRRS